MRHNSATQGCAIEILLPGSYCRQKNLQLLFTTFLTHNYRLMTHDSVHYSVLNDFTGFATAAFIAWKLTVSKVIAMAPVPAPAKIHQESPALY